MKKVTLFILLKIAEISAVIAAYLAVSGFGSFIHTFLNQQENDPAFWYHFFYFLIGIFTIIIASLLVMLVVKWIPSWFKSNWDWAGRIKQIALQKLRCVGK